jgi:hypothetical protein
MRNENEKECKKLFTICCALLAIIVLFCLYGCATYRSPALQSEIDGLKLGVRQLANENEGLRNRLAEIQSAGGELANGAYAISQQAGDDIATIRSANEYFETEFERLYKIIRGGDSNSKSEADMVEAPSGNTAGGGGISGN